MYSKIEKDIVKKLRNYYNSLILYWESWDDIVIQDGINNKTIQSIVDTPEYVYKAIGYSYLYNWLDNHQGETIKDFLKEEMVDYSSDKDLNFAINLAYTLALYENIQNMIKSTCSTGLNLCFLDKVQDEQDWLLKQAENDLYNCF